MAETAEAAEAARLFMEARRLWRTAETAAMAPAARAVAADPPRAERVARETVAEAMVRRGLRQRGVLGVPVILISLLVAEAVPVTLVVAAGVDIFQAAWQVLRVEAGARAVAAVETTEAEAATAAAVPVVTVLVATAEAAAQMLTMHLVPIMDHKLPMRVGWEPILGLTKHLCPAMRGMGVVLTEALTQGSSSFTTTRRLAHCELVARAKKGKS